jgi:hypothetical protein
LSLELPLPRSFDQSRVSKIRASAKRCCAGEAPVTDFSGPTLGGMGKVVEESFPRERAGCPSINYGELS